MIALKIKQVNLELHLHLYHLQALIVHLIPEDYVIFLKSSPWMDLEHSHVPRYLH